jgi:NADPH:quinone reductase-like Zn-dependent oxidoreductase
MAVSINAGDYRSMSLGAIPKNKIFGSDVAGQVEAVGKDIRKFKVGDEVFGDLSFCGLGGFAEKVTAPESYVAPKPARVSFVDAATLPMASLTALQGLRLGRIQSGQKVLILGAGGGVGTFAVQLARHFGAIVTAVCGPNNVDLIRSLGADRVIDYSKEYFRADGTTYDLILAVNGNHSLADYRAALKSGGKLVVVGGALSQVFSVMLFGWLYTITGIKMELLRARASTSDLEFIIGLVEAGQVKPVIDKTYPLEETVEAMKYISQGHARGKVVITIAGA